MNLPVLLASAAREHGTGPGGYGLYAALAALGALLGALASSMRRTPRLRWIVVSGVAYGALTVTAGLLPWYSVFLCSLIAIGWARLAFATAAETLTQLSTNYAVRGRVMSIYMLILFGGQAVGAILVGAIADAFGLTVGFLTAGLTPIVAGATIAILIRARRAPRHAFGDEGRTGNREER
jgi:MFS family permease